MSRIAWEKLLGLGKHKRVELGLDLAGMSKKKRRCRIGQGKGILVWTFFCMKKIDLRQ